MGRSSTVRVRSITDLFARSPFGPTQAHLKKAIDCAEQLRPLFDAALAEDQAALRQITDTIGELEAEADVLKNDIRNHLPKSLFLPVDRRDLLELIHMQDSIADSAQEVAGVLSLKHLSLPAELHPPVREFVEEILITCGMARAVGEEMDELSETSFAGPEAERVLLMIDQLNDAETKSDAFGTWVCRQLFALEAQMSSVDVMLWRQVFCAAGQVANYAERMANRTRLLIAKV
jgi:uncharacterized protein